MARPPSSRSTSLRLAFGALLCAAAASLWLLAGLFFSMSSAGFFYPSVPGRFGVLFTLILIVSAFQVFLFAWAFRSVARAPGQGGYVLLPTALALASPGFELLLIPLILSVALGGLYATRGNLGALRSAVYLFHDDTKRFPKSLSELVPTYLGELPPSRVLHHDDSAAVQLLSDDDYRKGLFNDAGGWAYVTSGPDAGTVLVNCTHRDPNGASWTSLGAPPKK